MAQKIWTEEKVLEEIKRIMKLLNLKVLPRYKDLKEHSTCMTAYTRYGGASWASMKLGVPLSGTERFRWTEETLMAEVERVMQLYDLHDRLPTYTEFDAVSTCWNSLHKIGGIEGVSERLGLPYYKRIMPEEVKEPEIRPSAAFQKEKESKKRYADIQKAESLELAGKIDISKYAGMKTWKERMEENEKVGKVQ